MESNYEINLNNQGNLKLLLTQWRQDSKVLFSSLNSSLFYNTVSGPYLIRISPAPLKWKQIRLSSSAVLLFNDNMTDKNIENWILSLINISMRRLQTTNQHFSWVACGILIKIIVCLLCKFIFSPSIEIVIRIHNGQLLRFWAVVESKMYVSSFLSFNLTKMSNYSFTDIQILYSKAICQTSIIIEHPLWKKHICLPKSFFFYFNFYPLASLSANVYTNHIFTIFHT